MLSTLTVLVASLAQDSIDFPEVVWHVPDALGVPTVTDDAVYSGGFGLFRIDRKTGVVLAEIDRVDRTLEVEGGVKLAYAGAPAIAGSNVIARKADGDVAAFDKNLTTELWSWRGEGQGYAQPGVLVEDTYYLADGQAIVALDISNGGERWKHYLSASVEMTPAVAEGMVFAGTSTGVFQAINRYSGEVEWTREGFGPFGWTNPVVSDGVVYVGDRGVKGSGDGVGFNGSTLESKGSRRGALHAFDTRSGKQEWGTVFGATGLSDPFVARKAVYAGFGKYVAEFDKKTGEIDESSMIRTGTNAFGSPTVIGKRIYFGNLDGHLYVHRLKGGALDWAFQVPGGQVQDFVHTGKNVYASTTKGLFALGPGRKGKGGRTLVWQG